ncbi:AlpA family transcriptional regulator [Azoarcus sp. KH32C]|uniref:helix-turn-helix transcriptional regulator n=1 Tax=Azoarcus sp. KH32C TaxID=748247 RepID=UPI0002385FCF|nr:helix-turn-helix domain-containing protein [Azoarcus sp. KH32C]BAL23498.1 hypothetical protein AZKH_1169 [Azoarcus sp. KH32C]
MTEPYQPITKEAAAHILSVSKRTIDNWLADGTIVEPSNIGRRVYWHPDIFYAWLNERLGVQLPSGPAENEDPQRTTTKPRGRPRSAPKCRRQMH